MDGIKNINIKNFRGIEQLTVEDFSRVNIPVGQNNSGKSSVLEALMFVSGMSNPFLPQNMISADISSHNPIPDLGELVKRQQKNNIIEFLQKFLIDEIDSGFHYSAYKKLWEAIFALAVSTDKQLFITTHSKETLQCLCEMLETNPADQSEMALFLKQYIQHCFGLNHDAGTFEDLLEHIVNPNNRPIFDCWKHYEQELVQLDIPGRAPPPLTTPAKKTKTYGSKPCRENPNPKRN